MKKLTAEKCRKKIKAFSFWRAKGQLSEEDSDYLQALEIALPVLEKQEAKKKLSLREGVEAIRKSTAESGGYNFDALRAEQEGDGWIEWEGGECPVGNCVEVEYRTRIGNKWKNQADSLRWVHEGWGGDIIAYRVVEQQERERGEEE